MPHLVSIVLLALLAGASVPALLAEEIVGTTPAEGGAPSAPPAPLARSAPSLTPSVSRPAAESQSTTGVAGKVAVVQPVAAIPPSPSTVPGVRIWPEPTFTHWPAIAYPEESRNVAFSLPVRQPGKTGSIGWSGEKPLPFTLPSDLERIGGLLPLPSAVGTYQAELIIGDQPVLSQFKLSVVDARQAWPHTALREGFPIDAQGIPVVLVDRRRDANQERKWALLNSLQKPRPTGRAVFIGDPLSALGVSAVDGVDMRVRVARDERHPVHAQMVALALDTATWQDQPLEAGPHTIFWSPGNQALLANTWTQEEERFLGVVRTRLEALAIFPRLVLVLPPAPIDDREPAQALARERRDLLRRAAAWQGWIILDVERVAGPAKESFLVADGVYAPGPVNRARETLAAAFRAELSR